MPKMLRLFCAMELIATFNVVRSKMRTIFSVHRNVCVLVCNNCDYEASLFFRVRSGFQIVKSAKFANILKVNKNKTYISEKNDGDDRERICSFL